MEKLDAFTESYLETALWSTCGDDGEPLDSRYGIVDLAPETIARAVADCKKFQTENATAIDLARTEYGQDEQRAGHDFWLTRNGHGAGFWDGDYGDVLGEQLTARSKQFGEADLYVGDDGRLYFA